jgi:hypothetical protein|tara:strand:+ start:720 stop:1379 length:660 start_codon:yes stop_codon:yes gene_type:complete
MTAPLRQLVVLLAIALTVLGTSQDAQAQVVIQAPYGVYNGSFYEHMGSTWSLSNWGRRGGWFFNGPGAGFPPFGGYHGFGGARFGFGGRLGNTKFRFNMWCSQASSRSMVMTAPMITIPNGGYGVIQNLSWRPFVTGWSPVVGGAPQVPMMSPVQQYVRQASSEAEVYKVAQPQTNSLIRRQAAIEAAKVEEPKRPPVVPKQPVPKPAAEDEDPPLILK